MLFLSNTKKLKNKKIKKWRFWRSFKRFFLNCKKKNFFCKIKWLSSQIKVVKKNYLQFYGKKLKHLIKKKVVRNFGGRFFYSISVLETRLNVLLLRMMFTKTFLEVNFFICKGFFLVNKKIKNKNYLIKVGDLIQKKDTIYFTVTKKDTYKWRKYLWSKWAWQARKKNSNYLDPFWLSKKKLSLNYVEINHKVLSGILLRKPLLGEVLLNSKKRFLTTNILKKIFFVY